MFHDRDKDKCVIVGEVTGADRPSVLFEMGGWMDGRMEEEEEKRAFGLGGVKRREVKCGEVSADRQTKIHPDIYTGMEWKVKLLTKPSLIILLPADMTQIF